MGDNKIKISAVGKIPKLAGYLDTLPLDKADDETGEDVIYFNDATDVNKIFEVYKKVDFTEKYDDVKAPAVMVAGWYDMFLGPQLTDYQKIMKQGGGETSLSRLIVGPWSHGPGGDGSVDFGPDGGMGNILGSDQAIQWMDYRLKGIDNEAKEWPPVKIFVMGGNIWRDENEWPLKRTIYTKYYLHSDGTANTSAGDGLLSVDVPDTNEPTDKFVYDPLDPVPTKGGNNLITNLGAYNQSKIEKRQDVLCYTTPVLENDVEVTGPISAVIYAASDAADTDFTLKLVDVHPDGKAVNIQDGIVRALYRDNDPTNPTPLTPGISKNIISIFGRPQTFSKKDIK